MSSHPQQVAAIKSTEDITIELCTRPAYRVWFGREKNEEKHGIMGVPGFCKLLKDMEGAIREGDPYADYHYHKIENALEDLNIELQNEMKDIEAILAAKVPKAMNLPPVGSENPTIVPVRIASTLGFGMVFRVVDLDEIVLKVLLASHIGVLTKKEKFQTLDRVEKKIRSTIYLVFNYRYMGVTRNDMAMNNQRAQAAKKAMGDLEEGYLLGTVRSDNAPLLPSSRLSVMGAPLDTSKSMNLEEDSVPLPKNDSSLDAPIAP